MKEIHAVYKRQGETPLECLGRFRVQFTLYKDEKMTYAGRLDPLAEGVIIFLSGQALYNKDIFLTLEKEYYVEVLCGFGTDTGDVLGLVEKKSDMPIIIPSATVLNDMVQKETGIKFRPYPAYSSKTVGGKTLFSLAREGLLPSKIPERVSEIAHIEYVAKRNVNSEQLLREITERVSLVSGDFRQEAILARWNVIGNETDKTIAYPVVTFKVRCGGGVYMRTLAESIGLLLDCPALAFKITRTKVGDYSIENSVRIS